MRELDPSHCCHVDKETANEHIPFQPSIHDLFFWETSLDALGVRKFPTSSSPSPTSFEWAMLMVGTREGLAKEAAIHDYWAGRDHGYFFGKHEEGKDLRPPGTKGRYMNNQGGWTATRRQVIEWHTKICARNGGFLPPYDRPGYNYDGLSAESVEYWSGGQQVRVAAIVNREFTFLFPSHTEPLPLHIAIFPNDSWLHPAGATLCALSLWSQEFSSVNSCITLPTTSNASQTSSTDSPPIQFRSSGGSSTRFARMQNVL